MGQCFPNSVFDTGSLGTLIKQRGEEFRKAEGVITEVDKVISTDKYGKEQHPAKMGKAEEAFPILVVSKENQEGNPLKDNRGKTFHHKGNGSQEVRSKKEDTEIGTLILMEDHHKQPVNHGSVGDIDQAEEGIEKEDAAAGEDHQAEQQCLRTAEVLPVIIIDQCHKAQQAEHTGEAQRPFGKAPGQQRNAHHHPIEKWGLVVIKLPRKCRRNIIT